MTRPPDIPTIWRAAAWKLGHLNPDTPMAPPGEEYSTDGTPAIDVAVRSAAGLPGSHADLTGLASTAADTLNDRLMAALRDDLRTGPCMWEGTAGDAVRILRTHADRRERLHRRGASVAAVLVEAVAA